MLKRFFVSLNLPKGKRNRRQNNRWRQFDPKVTIHYAHTVVFYSYMRASIPDSSSSPPCNNLRMLCIKSSIPSGDWNKMDITQGGWFVKYTATNYLQGSVPPKTHLQGKEAWVFTGTDETFMRCDGQIQSWDLRLWNGLLIRRDALRKRTGGRDRWGGRGQGGGAEEIAKEK